MPLVSLTNVNPYEVDRSKNIAASESLGGAIGRGLQNIGEGFLKAEELAEKRALADEERQFKLSERNRVANERLEKNRSETFGDYDQTVKKTPFLQETFTELGMEEKKTFTDLTTQLENQDLSNEERAGIVSKIEDLKASVGVRNTAITNLQTNMQEISNLAETEGIGQSSPPGIISFAADIKNGENLEGYTIEKDEDGRELITGETSEGYPIRLYMDDLASGKNQFRVIPDVNKQDITDGILTQIKENPIVEQYENSYGVAERVKADETGARAASLIEKQLHNEKGFRGIAGAHGFGYDDIKNLEEGGTMAWDTALSEEEVAALDKDGDGVISSPDELKGYLANQMLSSVMDDPYLTTSKQINVSKYQAEQKLILERQKADIKKEQTKVTEQKKQDLVLDKLSDISVLNNTKDPNDIGALSKYNSQKAANGQQIGEIVRKGNKVIITYQGHDKNNPKLDQFDISSPEGQKALAATLPDDPTTQFTQAVEAKASAYLIQ